MQLLPLLILSYYKRTSQAIQDLLEWIIQTRVNNSNELPLGIAFLWDASFLAALLEQSPTDRTQWVAFTRSAGCIVALPRPSALTSAYGAFAPASQREAEPAK